MKSDHETSRNTGSESSLYILTTPCLVSGIEDQRRSLIWRISRTLAPGPRQRTVRFLRLGSAGRNAQLSNCFPGAPKCLVKYVVMASK